MANEVRKITLTQLGSNAGPNFSVQYSADCNTYTQSADCTNIFLPSVGSFAYCTVDDSAVCIKLISKGSCTNEVVENPTVTSTTTASPTTTSTTTVSPTTSTTTAVPTTSTTTAAVYNYLIEECNTSDYYNTAQTYEFNVGDVVQFQVGTLGAGDVLCGTILSDTFSPSAPDATLYSAVAYECGDSIHCDFTPPGSTIYTHGAVRGTCSDYCNTNYLIQTLTNADGGYFDLTLGDTIYGQGGVAGWVAYSNVSTDTDTGPFRVAQIDSSGVVIDISVCVSGNCVPL